MQHFLRTLGLDRSYLFLNSFVYPIFNQYTPDLKVIAQNPVSPIAAHRNQILDKAIVAGDVRLVAVGNAAKESVASWIKTHGGNAQPGSLHEATMGNLPNRVRAVGVKHPGAAVGGSIEDIKDSFQAAQDQIKEWLDDDAHWLPVDTGMARNLTDEYKYKSAAIPFRDFPFGIARGSAAARRPATGATASGRSGCSRRAASVRREGRPPERPDDRRGHQRRL